MLKVLLMVASFANCAGGVVLILTWATMWQRVPIIVLFIGASLLIQGAYTILYLQGALSRWARRIDSGNHPQHGERRHGNGASAGRIADGDARVVGAVLPDRQP